MIICIYPYHVSMYKQIANNVLTIKHYQYYISLNTIFISSVFFIFSMTGKLNLVDRRIKIDRRIHFVNIYIIIYIYDYM